jgi:phospholipid/cholesterol/gamma-HCH transport system substrate-binding protein
MNRALAVGILAAVAGVMFLVALTFFRKGGLSERDSYLIHAYFTDATGLTWKSRIQIAGIQVGEIAEIRLEGSRARLDMRIKKEIDLHADACLQKTFPSALLPDAVLETAPGSEQQPLLKDLPVEEREIRCVRQATSTQQLLDAMSKIAQDVQLVTGDLAKTVTGNQGLRQIVENLSSITRQIDTLIAQNGDSMTAILSSTRELTGNLADVSTREKERMHQIAVNVEQLTANLRQVAASLQDIVDPGSAPPRRRPSGGVEPRALERLGVVAPPPPLDPSAAGDAPRREGAVLTRSDTQPDQAPGVPGTPGQPGAPGEPGERPEVKGVRQAVAKLNDTLAKLDDVVAKVHEGKSVAGKLLSDEKLGRELSDTVTTVSEYVERLDRLQIQLQLRSEWLLNQTLQSNGRPGSKIYFSARILPRPDKYYLLELVSDPRGVDTITTSTVDTEVGGQTTRTVTTTRVNEQKLTFSAEFAKRYGPLTFRIGIIEGSGGAGTDLHLLDDALQLSFNLYQFDRAFQAPSASSRSAYYPRAKFWANYYFLQHFFVTSGVDDFLNRFQTGNLPGGRRFNIGTDVFFGGGVYFTDEDLKTLIGAGAGSVAPRL